MAGNYRSGRLRWREMLEEYDKVDVMELKRDGVFDDSRGGIQISPSCLEAAFAYEQGRLTILRASSDSLDGCRHPSTQLIVIDFQPCPFGGQRPWFLCPACGKRVAALYADESCEYTCRVCQGLAYRSQFETWSGRRYLKANRMRWRMGGEAGAGSLFVRPTWMRWEKFFSTIQRIHALETAALLKAVESYPWSHTAKDK